MPKPIEPRIVTCPECGFAFDDAKLLLVHWSCSHYARLGAIENRLRMDDWDYVSQAHTEMIRDAIESYVSEREKMERDMGKVDKNEENQKDPWIHRSAKMKCKTCMWFVGKGEGEVGRCRRHAPSMGGYPVVMREDWCGDHRVDEEKL